MCEVCDTFRPIDKIESASEMFRALADVYRRKKLPLTNRMWTKLIRVSEAIQRVDAEGGPQIGQTNPHQLCLLEELGGLRALLIHTTRIIASSDLQRQLLLRFAERVDGLMDRWGLCVESIHLTRLKADMLEHIMAQHQQQQPAEEAPAARSPKARPTYH